ncbi:DNA repair protein RecO [Alphaproteobacteria bacterium]|nr:DNA repair protein RecO [Alphaproteobacteria bacterium]
MFKTPAIITKIDNYKENHLLISLFSSEYGKKSLIVFGGKSKKKNTDFVKGVLTEIEFNKENSCLNSNLIQSYNWFLFDKYRLKVVDYICFLINKLLFLEDQNSKILNCYQNLLIAMNNSSNYLVDLIQLELEVLKSSGYQPDLSESVMKKLLGDNFSINANSYEELSSLLRKNLSFQEIFSNFMEKVIAKVLNNLNIHLPFKRSEIIKKN